MEKLEVRRTGRRNLIFTGQLLACGSDRAPDDLAGARITAMIYKTVVGKYILALRVHFTISEERDVFKAMSFSSSEDVIEFIGMLFDGNSALIDTMVQAASKEDVDFSRSYHTPCALMAYAPETGMTSLQRIG